MTLLNPDETTSLRAAIPWYRREGWWMKKPPAIESKPGIDRFRREDISMGTEKADSMPTYRRHQ